MIHRRWRLDWCCCCCGGMRIDCCLLRCDGCWWRGHCDMLRGCSCCHCALNCSQRLAGRLMVWVLATAERCLQPSTEFEVLNCWKQLPPALAWPARLLWGSQHLGQSSLKGSPPITCRGAHAADAGRDRSCPPAPVQPCTPQPGRPPHADPANNSCWPSAGLSRHSLQLRIFGQGGEVLCASAILVACAIKLNLNCAPPLPTGCSTWTSVAATPSHCMRAMRASVESSAPLQWCALQWRRRPCGVGDTCCGAKPALPAWPSDTVRTFRHSAVLWCNRSEIAQTTARPGQRPAASWLE